MVPNIRINLSCGTRYLHISVTLMGISPRREDKKALSQYLLGHWHCAGGCRF